MRVGQWVANGCWYPQGLNIEGNIYPKRPVVDLRQLRALSD